MERQSGAGIVLIAPQNEKVCLLLRGIPSVKQYLHQAAFIKGLAKVGYDDKEGRTSLVVGVAAELSFVAVQQCALVVLSSLSKIVSGTLRATGSHALQAVLEDFWGQLSVDAQR